MNVVSFSNAADFAQHTRTLLHQHEAEHGMLLGLIAAAVAQPASLAMWSVEAAGQCVAAAVANDVNLFVSKGPDAAWLALAASVASEQRNVPGVVGPAASAEAMAQAWAVLRGGRAYVAMDQGVFACSHIVAPQAPAAGCAVQATLDDIASVTDLLAAFHNEAIPHEQRPPEFFEANARARIEAGMAYLWRVGETAVALASLARPSQTGIAVNAVYTPPTHRRHGYAAALVAHVSAAGLARGKRFCVLYTDLANPTSNGIYQRIGYRRIGDARCYRLEVS